MTLESGSGVLVRLGLGAGGGCLGLRLDVGGSAVDDSHVTLGDTILDARAAWSLLNRWPGGLPGLDLLGSHGWMLKVRCVRVSGRDEGRHAAK